jgi:hypothetical protein
VSRCPQVNAQLVEELRPSSHHEIASVPTFPPSNCRMPSGDAVDLRSPGHSEHGGWPFPDGVVPTAPWRLADAVARVASARHDVSTLLQWAALVCVSRRTLCLRCQAAGVPPKPSLNLGRLARTLLVETVTCDDWRPEELLGTYDPRTTAALLKEAGVREWHGAKPPTIEELVLHLAWPMPLATRSALMQALLGLRARRLPTAEAQGLRGR